MEIIAFSNNFKKKKENSHRYALLTLFLLTSSATKIAAIPQSSPRDNLKDIKTTIHATLNFIPHEPRKRLHCKPRKIFVTSEQGRHRIHGIEVTTIALRHPYPQKHETLWRLTFYLYVALRPPMFRQRWQKAFNTCLMERNRGFINQLTRHNSFTRSSIILS